MSIGAPGRNARRITLLVTIALALVGPWMGRQVLAFAVRAFGGH